MSTVIESGIGTLNYGKQASKGTVATAATIIGPFDRPKWFEGGLKVAKVLGSEEFIDGQRFASPSMFVETIGGAVGTLTVQAQAENAPLYAAQMLGVDTVTGAADPWMHTVTSAGTSGAWGTWWQKVGSTVGPHRELYSDSKIAKLTMMSSDKQKVMHYTIDVMSLNPAQVYTTDPAKTEATTDPYYWVETSGAVTFDGTVLSDINEEVLELDLNLTSYYSNAIYAAQLIEGKVAKGIVRTLKTLVTDVTLEKYNKAIYGEVAPVAGVKPATSVIYAAAKSVYEKTATRKMTLETPRMAVDPATMEIAAHREGGEIPISFGGMCLKEGATPALTIIALNGEKEPLA